MKDEEPFRPKEPVRKATVWVPLGARENVTAVPSDPPFTEYGDVAKELLETLKENMLKKKVVDKRDLI